MNDLHEEYIKDAKIEGPDPVTEAILKLRPLMGESKLCPSDGSTMRCYKGASYRKAPLPHLTVHSINLNWTQQATRIQSETLNIRIYSETYDEMRYIRNKIFRALPGIHEASDRCRWDTDVPGGVLHTTDLYIRWSYGNDKMGA